MSRSLTEPTTALTVLEPRPALRSVEDAADLEIDEINEILLHHDQRALWFGIGAALVCGPLTLVVSESMWAAPFIAALAAGIGGVASEVARRRDAARDLGVERGVVAAVEGEMGRAILQLVADDVRQGRWRELFLRSPSAYRAALAERVHARLQLKKPRG